MLLLALLVGDYMNVNIPYDELTLKIALMGISSKMESEGLQEKLLEKISGVTAKSMAEFNTKTAEFHGISIEALISSSNYETLKAEYGNSCVMQILNIYKEAGFSDKESWALVCVGLGKLME